MKNYIKEEVIEFLAEKQSVRERFLRYVQDSSHPILERLDVWESYADDVLPVGDWLSQAPTWLRSANADLTRGSKLSFIDLVDSIDSEDDTQIGFDPEGNITWLSDEAIEALEDVFNTGLCGTHVDW